MNPQTDQKLSKMSSSVWAFFINRRPIAWLVILGSIMFGITAASSMPKEVQPEINIPFGIVSTALPGASPSDVESLITKPLEDEIAGIDDIKVLSSTSGFGFSQVAIEFEASADLDKSIEDLKDAVDLAKPELPEDATDPVVVRAEPNAFSIISFSITGDRPVPELTKIAENVKEELETVSNVKRIDVTGGIDELVFITLNQEKVEGYNLDINTIANNIDFSNSNLPIGIISSDKLNYSVRIDNRYKELADIGNLPITQIGDDTILLKDIADIEISFPTQSVISKFSVDGKPSKKSVTLQIYNKDNSNILQVVDDSKAMIEDLKGNVIPDDIEVGVSNDNSEFIRQDLGILVQNGIQTSILITVILFLALGIREGLIAGLSMPIIFLITFAVMQAFGMTINSLSLFSLVIALGLMVDTTIVIMEGIDENLKKGYSPKQSALLSVETYKWPLVAGTMTTIFAFFPMLLVSGILGEFLRTLPITISAALFSSLFISLTVSPSIATKFVKKKDPNKRSSILEPIFHRIGQSFENIIEKIISRRSYRVMVLLASILLFIASLSLPISGMLKVEMFPKTDLQYFIVRIETPKGTVVEETEKIAEKIEKEILEIPELKNFVSNIGTSQTAALSDEGFVPGGSSSSNLANITVNLVDSEERERKSYQIASALREDLSSFNQAKIEVEELTEGPPSDPPVSIQITGQETEVLRDLSNQVEQIVKDLPGTQNVKNTFETGLNEFKFTLDRDKLAYHGLSPIQTSAIIRNIIQGVETTTISLDGEDVDIVVRYDLPEVKDRTNLSIRDIENFQIPTPKGYSVALSEIADYDFGESLSSISREDQKRIIKITSDLDADLNAVEITQQLEEKIAQIDIPNNYEIGFGGEFDDIQESFQDLFRSMAVGIVLVAFTLILMFNSFKQAFIILTTLPLALIGVFPGLMLVGLNLSFPAFLGVVALTGVVVNDSIVLIDRINENRRNGVRLTEAISESAEARLQPIIMTSITTIVGILPLAISNEFWAGLGFSLIFGLAFSTILTLVVIPVIYFAFESGKVRKQNPDML